MRSILYEASFSIVIPSVVFFFWPYCYANVFPLSYLYCPSNDPVSIKEERKREKNNRKNSVLLSFRGDLASS